MPSGSQLECVFELELVRLGLDFESQVARLPGTPDFLLRETSIAIFVHGCYWHRHAGCSRRAMPRSNILQWVDTFSANVARDQKAMKSLRAAGVPVFIAWECHILCDAVSVGE